MLKKFLVLTVGVVIVLSVYAGFKSPEMVVSRELAVKASAEKVFRFINNSKLSNEWMTWTETDPTTKMTYSGPDEGVGSVASWSAEGQMGVGSATIIESVANRSVKTKLTYIKPMEMSQIAEVSLQPSGLETIVRWSVTGNQTFIFRLMSIFVNVDQLIGESFEKGLKNLKSKVEAQN